MVYCEVGSISFKDLPCAVTFKMPFFFKPQHLDVLKVLDVSCKIPKYSNHIFFSHFELTSMSFPGTITFWELEIPNSGHGIKPSYHPVIVYAALPLRTVYIG